MNSHYSCIAPKIIGLIDQSISGPGAVTVKFNTGKLISIGLQVCDISLHTSAGAGVHFARHWSPAGARPIACGQVLQAAISVPKQQLD